MDLRHDIREKMDDTGVRGLTGVGAGAALGGGTVLGAEMIAKTPRYQDLTRLHEILTSLKDTGVPVEAGTPNAALAKKLGTEGSVLYKLVAKIRANKLAAVGLPAAALGTAAMFVPAALKTLTGKEASDWHGKAQEGLDKTAVDLDALRGDASERLSDFWAKLSPDTQDAITGSLVGAVLAGGAGAGAGLLASEKGEALRTAMKEGLLAAALGGVVGGTGVAGYKAMTGGRKLPGEVDKSWSPGQSMSNAVVGTAAKHPATALGGLAGTILAVRGLSSVPKVMDEAAQSVNAEEALRKVIDVTQRGSRADVLGTAERGLQDLNRPSSLRQLFGGSGSRKAFLERMLGRMGSHGALGAAASLGAVPTGLALGYLVDKYLKGQYYE